MEKMKKCLFISPTPGFGGAECYMITMAERASEHGFTPVMCFEKRAETQPLSGMCQRKKIQYVPCKIANEISWTSGSSMTSILLKVCRVLRAIHLVKPAVIHLTLPNPIFGVHIMIAAALLRIPVVVVFQWVGEVVPLPENKRSIYRWCRRHKQHWIAVSRRDAAMISGAFGMDVDQVIQNAAVSTHIKEKKEYGIAGTSFIKFVTVGRVGMAKGHDLIVQAIPHILKKDSRCRFIWVGGSSHPSLPALIEQYGVAEYIDEEGLQESVAEWLTDADFFLLPSRSEGQSFALSEAMAAGVPILCSDAGGCPEVVRDRENGVIFRANDGCDMLAAIHWGLENYDKMISMGKKAKDDFKKYTGEMMVRDTYCLMDRGCAAESL